jgi:hypothetical protein
VKRIFLLLLLLLIGSAFSHAQSFAPARSDPVAIIDQVSATFKNIKDAEIDFRLEVNLFLFGCSGLQVFEGHAYFKYPDRIKVVMRNGTGYFAQGNYIKKTDPHGKVTYYRFVNSPDFSVGYQPDLISHNFYLKILRQSAEEVAIEGLPKPGVLKNVNKVNFYIDPVQHLVKKLDIFFANQHISGGAEVKYEKKEGIMVPVFTSGKSAFELRSGALLGFGFKLYSSNMKVNQGVPDSVFQ